MYVASTRHAERCDLDHLVGRRARYTAQYAFENSPFYHDLFREHNVHPKDIDSPEDLLKKLPIVTKKDIVDNQPPNSDDYRFFSAPKDQWAISNYTSGTQGTSKVFLRSHDDIDISKIELRRAYEIAGVKEDDTVLIVLPYGMGTSGVAATRGFEKLAHVLTAGIGDNPPKTELVEYHKPTVLFGSPSSVARLARRFELAGTDPTETSIERILTVSEPLSKEMKEFISKRWNAEVRNNYASTEGDLMATECDMQEGLHHVKEDYLWLRAIDPETKELKDEGETGWDVITTLVPEGTYCGMVLINYQHGDKFKMLGDECGCGSILHKISPPIRAGELGELEVGYTRIGLDELEAVMLRPEFTDYLTGEYEVIKEYDSSESLHKIKLRVETRGKTHKDLVKWICDSVHNHFTLNIVATGPSRVADIYVETVPEGRLDIYKQKGKPKRIITKKNKF
ncbi:MAG: phenylacetate--CoA ligase family protein [Candidatus Aenigmatarchaeota archaeon]